jgi:hypothetical protein
MCLTYTTPGETRNVCKDFGGKLHGRRPNRRTWRWDDIEGKITEIKSKQN